MSGRPELLQYAEEPEIANADEVRQYRKHHLAASFRAFARLRYDTGPGGHAAVRDPEHPSWFWTNPFGLPFEMMRASDLMLIDDQGNLVEGAGVVNRAAFAIHAGIHDARPDVIASVHLHGVAGTAFSALGEPLLPINQDACAFYESHSVYTGFDGPALEEADGQRMAKVLGDGKALILQNHGLLTAGTSIDEAAFWMIRMQTCCEMQLLAERTGRPLRIIPPDLARLTSQVVGRSRAGWFGFQTFYQRIAHKEPDTFL